MGQNPTTTVGLYLGNGQNAYASASPYPTRLKAIY
jgi:hypothetical protein